MIWLHIFYSPCLKGMLHALSWTNAVQGVWVNGWAETMSTIIISLDSPKIVHTQNVGTNTFNLDIPRQTNEWITNMFGICVLVNLPYGGGPWYQSATGTNPPSCLLFPAVYRTEANCRRSWTNCSHEICRCTKSKMGFYYSLCHQCIH